MMPAQGRTSSSVAINLLAIVFSESFIIRGRLDKITIENYSPEHHPPGHHPKFTHPVMLANLDKFVSAFESSKCLVTIDNYSGINVPLFSYPSIVRKPELTTFHFNHSTYARIVKKLVKIHFWKPAGFFLNVSNVERNKRSVNCSSTFLTEYENKKYAFDFLEDICLPLNIISYSSSSKPWNCQVQFYLFPPSLEYRLTPPRVLKLEQFPEDTVSYAYLPSTIAPVQIFV